MSITMIGLDTAKSVFQVHGVNETGKVEIKRKLRRSELIPFFEKLDACTVVMEACGAAHHWPGSCPVMGSTARLHNDGAGIQLLKERDQFAPSQLALDLHLSGLVHAVHLKDGLGGVQADHGNAHRGRLPLYRFSRPVLWHTDAVGAVHPICRT